LRRKRSKQEVNTTMAINVEGIKPDIYRLAAELEHPSSNIQAPRRTKQALRKRIVAVYGPNVWIDVLFYVLAGLHSRSGELQGVIEAYEEAYLKIFETPRSTPSPKGGCK
jgi:hypothetical protein